VTPTEKATKIVHKMMLQNDSFSQWMDIEIIKIVPGSCHLKTIIRKEMLNGFQTCHGGVTFSIADSALAFASNSHGIQAVSIEISISHFKPVSLGDIITAVAIEKNLSNRLGNYEVSLTNQHGELVALFKGTVFRNGKEWEI
jgi:acyl-CoA thioesterase